MEKKSTNRLKISTMASPMARDLILSIWGRPTTGATYLMDSFPSLYRITLDEIRGRFTAQELYLMIDVMNGTMLTAGIAGQHLRTNIIDGMFYDNLDEKWDVDKQVLYDKLQALTIYQAAIIEVWVQAFWAQCDPAPENITIEDYVATLSQEGVEA